jgi:hypothetical protein
MDSQAKLAAQKARLEKRVKDTTAQVEAIKKREEMNKPKEDLYSQRLKALHAKEAIPGENRDVSNKISALKKQQEHMIKTSENLTNRLMAKNAQLAIDRDTISKIEKAIPTLQEKLTQFQTNNMILSTKQKELENEKHQVDINYRECNLRIDGIKLEKNTKEQAQSQQQHKDQQEQA